MEKEFIPYEQALALRKLGLKVDFAFGHYNYSTRKMRDYINERVTKSFFPAPTFSQAFRWFREKYKLYSCIERVEYINSDEKGFQWSIFEKCSNVGEELKTYEEAELECLKKLIEIVKRK